MSRYLLVKAGVVLSVLAAAAAPSRAQDQEVVSIKRGTFEVEVLPFAEDTNELRISGNRGFVLSGRVSFGSNFYDAVEQCLLPGGCRPGTVVSLSDAWSGTDVVFSGKLQGLRFAGDGTIADENSAVVGFSASITMPPMSDGPVSVTAPFDFAGLVSLGGAAPRLIVLAGGGSVTVTLVPNPDSGGETWMIQQILFTFRPTAQR